LLPLFIFVVMGTAEKIAAFLGNAQAQAIPALQQLGANAQAAGQNIANTVATNFGQIKNQPMNMAPMGAASVHQKTQQFLSSLASSVPSSVQRTASQAGGIVPGAMEAMNVPGAAAVRQFQQQKGNLGGIEGLTASRAMGYGLGAATATGLIGAGVIAGRASKKDKARVAGQNLGAQLGVGMPPQY